MSFRTHGNILEHVTINTDVFPNTSAAATSLCRYSMTDYDKAVFSVGVFSTARSSVGPVGVATFIVKESSDSTGALSAIATISGTSMPGQSAASLVQNAKIVDFVMVATGTTEGDVIIVNGVTFTYTTSTANLAASAASGRYFGHDGALGSAGLATLTLQTLATILTNATYGVGPGVIDANFSFPTTSILEIMVTDTASTYLTVQTTAVPLLAPWFVYGEAHIEVHADDMTTGEKYLSLAISTQDQNVAKTISVVRTGRRAGGVADHHHGRFIKST